MLGDANTNPRLDFRPYADKRFIHANYSFSFRTKDATYNDDDGSVRLFLRGRPVTLYAPTAITNEGNAPEPYSLAKVSPAPAQKLKLEWVYGYRGRDAR